MSQKSRNKLINIYNGNVLKFLHLNKSAGNIKSKLLLLNLPVSKEVPRVISLNESNCTVSKSDGVKTFDGY